MRRHIFVGAGLLALLAVPLATPAGAHSGTDYHRLEWGADAPADGERLYGTDFITVRARFTDGVDKWRIEMRPENGGPAVSFCEKPETSESRDLTYRCNWDTRRYGDMSALAPDAELEGAPIAPNGRYIVTVTVWNNGQDNVLTSDIPAEAHMLPTRTLIVENPVAVPAGVARSFDSGGRRITVNWAPNPEPDITEYVIREKFGAGEWTEAGRRAGTATSFQRDVTEPGTYQYRVSAVRPEVGESAWAETEPLEVASIPEAAPAGPDGSASPQGDPGVFIPEDPTTTTTGSASAAGGPKPTTSAGSTLFSRPSTNSLRSTPRATTPTTQFDPGYSETLPYTLPQNGAEAEPEEEELAGGDEPQTMTKIISVPKPRDPRALLVPLAGGLAMFVLSMQVTVAMRRRPALAEAEDDFSDWMGL